MARLFNLHHYKDLTMQEGKAMLVAEAFEDIRKKYGL